MPTVEEEIEGVPDTGISRDDIKVSEVTPIKTTKTYPPKVRYITDSYMIRDRKPARAVLTILEDNSSDHLYNISIKGALRTHEDTATKALLTKCTSLLGKSTFT